MESWLKMSGDQRTVKPINLLGLLLCSGSLILLPVKSLVAQPSNNQSVNRNELQPSTLIPPTARIEDSLTLTSNINYISGRYGGWSTNPMFPEAEKAKAYIGQSFSIFMPLEINGASKNYTFTFNIVNVKP